jgi:hypothetical protein
MRLTPPLIHQMDEIAQAHGDDPFLAIKFESGWFICNWVFGLAFTDRQVMKTPAFERLIERGNAACDDEIKLDILHHIYQRSWVDVLVGKGLMQNVELVQLRPDEAAVFTDRFPVIPFQAHNGRRFYIRERYFDLAERVLGDFRPVIFRPINSRAYPNDYRPMIFTDTDNNHLGMVYAISEENLAHPVDREQEYARYVRATMPEMFGG